MKNKDKKIEVSEVELMKMKKAMSYLDTIMDHSMDVIVLTDSKGYILKVNKYFLKLLGCTNDEVLKEHISKFGPKVNTTYTSTTGESVHIGDKFFEETMRMYEEFVEEKKAINRQSYFVSKKEILIPVEENMSFFHDEKGNVVGAIAIIRDITEQKRAEEALMKSEEKYRGVVNNIGIGVSLISPNMEILALNNQMQQWFPEVDVSKKPICYQTFNNPPREKVCSYCPTFKTLKDGQVHESITDTPQGDKVIHYRIISSPLKDKEGKITSAIEMVEDITAQMATQEELQKSEEKYHNLIEKANDAIVSVNTAGMIIGFNKKAEEIFGYSCEEVIGKSSYMFIPHQDKETFEKAMKRFATTGIGLERGENILEGKAVKKDGTKIQIEYSYYTIDVEGEFIATAIIRDITERKRVEEALKKSEEKYYKLIEHANDAIVSTNPQGTILGFNRRAEQMFGYSREEILGKSSELLVAEQNRKEQKEEEKKLGEIGNRYNSGQRIMGWTCIRKNGEEFPIEFTFYSIEIGGEIIANSIVRDVSKRKEEEKKLINYQKKLKDLTTELVLAEQKERQYFADFLHDEIGQQLFATRLQLELLKGSISSAENTKTLDNALNTLKQVMNQTRSLTSELSSPILKQLGLEKALEWLAEETHKKYDIMVAFEDDRQEKPLDDNTQLLLYQAVSELLTNVAKHAQVKNASVSIKKYNSSVQICVGDNGVGFSLPIDKSSHATTEGIGLFRIKERLEPLGGQLEIESQPNHGTKVTLVAPLDDNFQEQKT